MSPLDGTRGDSCDEQSCAVPPRAVPPSGRRISVALRYAIGIAAFVSWFAVLQLLAAVSYWAPITWLLATAAGAVYSKVRHARWLSRSGGLDAVLANGKPTVLEIYSDFCLPCLAVKPLVAQLRHDLGSSTNVVTLSVVTPNGMRAAKRFVVAATPTFIVFDSTGEETWRGNAPPSAQHIFTLP